MGGCFFVPVFVLSCALFELRPESSDGPQVSPAVEISLTNTPLPPLPDFDEIISFAPGAGGEADEWVFPDNFTYTGPPPAAQGGLSFRSFSANGRGFQNLPRLAYLYLWGFPADRPFKISLVSPDGSQSLSGDFRVSVDPEGNQKLIWPDQETELVDVHTSQNSLATEIDFWWPGTLAEGVWKIEVTWQGGAFTGEFDAGNKGLPEIYLEETGPADQFLPLCHPARHQTDLPVIGEGFPVTSLAYILLYERYPSFNESNRAKHFKLVWKSSALTDGNGTFRSTLPYEIKSGFTYQLIAVTDSNVSITEQLYGETIDAADCFQAPISRSACTGAPPQRMIPGLLGYVCTQAERFDIYESPGMLSSAIDVLTPGDYFLVVGEPQCMDNQSWWQIETGWGTVGWVPESDATGSYAICLRP